MQTEKIQEILVSQNYVSSDDMLKAVDFAKKHHINLTDYLITDELIDKKTLLQAIGEYNKIPYVDLEKTKPTQEMVKKHQKK